MIIKLVNPDGLFDFGDKVFTIQKDDFLGFLLSNAESANMVFGIQWLFYNNR